MTGRIASVEVKPIIVEHPPEQVPFTKGQHIQGVIIDKSSEGTIVQVEGQEVSLSPAIKVIEAEGEKADFEVVQSDRKVLALKYLRPNSDMRSFSDETNEIKPVKIVKDYQAIIQQSLKQADDRTMDQVMTMVKDAQQSIETITNTLTDEDVRQMLKEGMNPEKASLEIVVQVLKHNRTMIREQDSEGLREAVEAKVQSLKASYKNEERLKEVVTSLKEAQLPVFKKHVDKLVAGLNTLDDLKTSSPKEAMQILYNFKDVRVGHLSHESKSTSSDQEPSLKHLYKSIHTPLPKSKPMNIEDKELDAMVVKHMENHEIEVTVQKLEVARAMVQRGIAVSEEKIDFVIQPKEILAEIESSDVLKRMVNQLKASENITNVRIPQLSFINDVIQEAEVGQLDNPLHEASITEPRKEVLRHTIDLVSKITDMQTVRAVMTHRNDTLEQVVSVIEGRADTESQLALDDNHREIIGEEVQNDAAEIIHDESIPLEKDALESVRKSVENDYVERTEEVIKFKKQLSIIQLKMTFDAALRLEKQGIRIDTEPISKVVENLEAQEATIKEHQLLAYSGQKSVDHEQLEVFATTLQHLEQSKGLNTSSALQLQEKELPVTLRNLVNISAAIGEEALIKEVKVQVDQEKYFAGNQNDADNAISKYEQSMTEVRRDLGDRIEQTFSQIEPMLKEMSLPVTKANIQAVEILAKNTMAITEAHILEVQVIQEKIDLIAEKMTPVVVVEMAQAGINPIDLTIDELLVLVSAYEEENQLTDTSKISELILAMDQSETLTSEERKSLIAIYRTMDTVSRSKGSATGFMVKNKMTLSINNLFEAAKYIRKTGQTSAAIQVAVNDDFGMLESVTNKDATLHEQVRSQTNQVDTPSSNEQAEIKNESTTEAIDEPSLTGVELLHKELMDIRIRAFVHRLSPEAYMGVERDEEVDGHEVMPIEEVTALMDRQSRNKVLPQVNVEKYLSFIKENPEFLRSMVMNKIPLTFENFSKSIAMHQDSFIMMHEVESLLEAVESPELRSEMTEKLTKVAQDVLASKVPYEALNKAMDEVEQSIRDAVEPEPATVYKNAASLKATVNHTQMIQVTEDYYQIPVFMNQQVTQLNMYILNEQGTVQNSDESKILMSFEAGSLGKVQALMTLKGNSASLQIQSTYPEDREILKNYKSAFTEVMGQSNYTLAQIGYETFTVKEPVEIGREVPSNHNNNHLSEGHIDWSA